MPRKKKDPRKTYAHKTAVFQIHNPSARKVAMLRDALKRNHLAYSKILPMALSELANLEKIPVRQNIKPIKRALTR